MDASETWTFWHFSLPDDECCVVQRYSWLGAQHPARRNRSEHRDAKDVK